MRRVLVSLDGMELMLAGVSGVFKRVRCIQNNWKNAHGASEANAWKYDIEGCIGEIVVAKMFGMYWAGQHFDMNLPDVGDYQVRFTPWPDGKLIVHPPTGQKPDSPNDAFILVRRSRPPFEVAGWLMGHEAQQERYWTELTPGRPCYAVPDSDLRCITTLGPEIVGGDITGQEELWG